ncbi:BBE domain-containing protein [Ascidiimonas sp. W6]|uniref:BBE domain-containing protein n=1 Tax=Ascidiimonas meishanensis TaxID=3128903 RepID=UPI0030EE084A
MDTNNYVKIAVEDATPQFPSFLQGFNRRWFAGNCEAIYLCYNAQGTAQALEDAIINYGDKVKIKGGGHCYENFVFSNDTKAIIDVGPMNDVGYEADKGYYLGSGGTNWSAFKTLFRDYGKVLPAGSCYSVGLGGHICGGGYGLLSRLNGLTTDWLTGLEIVVKPSARKPAKTVYVTADSDNDAGNLFWASTGGGGGNFGVITRYYFKELPTVPQTALLTTIAFKWDALNLPAFKKLLDWYANFSATTPRNQFGLFKLLHVANQEIQLIIQTTITKDLKREAAYNLIQQQLQELSAIASHHTPQAPIFGHGNIQVHPSSSHTTEYTYYEISQTLNGSGANQRGKYKSAYMRKAFPPAHIKAIYEYLHIVPNGLTLVDMQQSLLQVDTYGGRINTINPSTTAIAQRSSIMKLQYQTYWTDESKDAFHLQWIRDFYSTVYAATGGTPSPALDPNNNVDGCYYNYCDSDLNDIVGKEGALRLYFLDNLPRLVGTKQQWDPNNYFNHAQSFPVSLDET